jgi:hypothetical protein
VEHHSTPRVDESLDVDMLNADSLPSPPPELDLSKFQAARARFSRAFIDICSPAFQSVTQTVLPVLQSFQAAVAPSPPPVLLVPSPPQPCALASIPLVPNPLARPPSSVRARPYARKWKFQAAPDLVEARRALESITLLLHGKRKKGKSIKPFKCDMTTQERLTRMKMLLRIYTHTLKAERQSWIAASLHVAHAHGESTAKAESLRQWTRAYMEDRKNIPVNLYGKWTPSMLNDGDLSKEIFEHLQSVGKYVKAMDVVWYIDKPKVREKFKLKKGISPATAKRWMTLMDYRWRKTPKGQFKRSYF